MNRLPHASGLYMLISPSGGRYIGMTTRSMRRRFWRHVAAANAGDPTRIADAFRKYGKDNIEGVPLVVCDNEEVLKLLERRAIAAFGTTKGRNYNIRECWSEAPDTTGYRHTEVARKRIAVAQKGRVRSAETRARIAAGQMRTPVMAEGSSYPSINEAARGFGLNPGTVLYRLNTDHYEEWYCGA